jgi:hypothetical protein
MREALRGDALSEATLARETTSRFASSPILTGELHLHC